MRMTLQEIMDTCPDWLDACKMFGFSEWAVNEGGGHVTVEITTQQAHQLRIVKLPEWKVDKPKDSSSDMIKHCDSNNNSDSSYFEDCICHRHPGGLCNCHNDT